MAILEEMGILLSSLPGGKVQISHLMQKAKTPEDAEEGWHLMQDIMRLMNQQQNPGTLGVREGGRGREWMGERERERERERENTRYLLECSIAPV